MQERLKWVILTKVKQPVYGMKTSSILAVTMITKYIWIEQLKGVESFTQTCNFIFHLDCQHLKRTLLYHLQGPSPQCKTIPLEACGQAVRVNVSNGLGCWHLTDNLSPEWTAIKRRIDVRTVCQYLQAAPSVCLDLSVNIYYIVSHYQPSFVIKPYMIYQTVHLDIVFSVYKSFYFYPWFCTLQIELKLLLGNQCVTVENNEAM